jgi:hypothetical protein
MQYLQDIESGQKVKEKNTNSSQEMNAALATVDTLLWQSEYEIN